MFWYVKPIQTGYNTVYMFINTCTCTNHLYYCYYWLDHVKDFKKCI